MNSRQRPPGAAKRVFTPGSFAAAVGSVVASAGDLRTAARSGRVSKALAERAMLAVSRVNGCRYCTYGHSRAALKAGVPAEELSRLLAGDLGVVPADEAAAVVFAQHYAESGQRPDPAAWQRLVDEYGPDKAKDLLAYLRMITFGNLLGNTLDAFLGRFAGRAAPGSTAGGELLVLVLVLVLSLVAAPFIIIARLFFRPAAVG